MAKALLVSDAGVLSCNAEKIGLPGIDERVTMEYTKFRSSFSDRKFDDMWDDGFIYSVSVLDWWNGYARNERGSDGLPLFGLLADMADIMFRLAIAASSAGAQFRV